LCDVTFSSFSSSFSSFLPFPNRGFLAPEFVVELFYFLNVSSEFVLPRVADASLFFLGVVIKFSFDELLSLSVAYVDN
jgi:hypothetical protein